MREEWLKDRVIAVQPPDGDAAAVIASLLALDGVEAAAWRDPAHLQVRYDLHHIDLRAVLARVGALGVRFDGGRLALCRRWLAQYAEEVQREAADADAGWDAAVRRIYVSRYRHRRHGRRDDRPQQWRKYLEGETDSDNPRPPA